ncbi:MAG: hypothetical protein MZV49_08750 [Rhodopseudomonas palustris]|nr:hypothetical protein [Rhodopseudomonas palustris]
MLDQCQLTAERLGGFAGKEAPRLLLPDPVLRATGAVKVDRRLIAKADETGQAGWIQETEVAGMLKLTCGEVQMAGLMDGQAAGV